MTPREQAEKIVKDWCDSYLELTWNPVHGFGRGSLDMIDAITTALASERAKAAALESKAAFADRVVETCEALKARFDIDGTIAPDAHIEALLDKVKENQSLRAKLEGLREGGNEFLYAIHQWRSGGMRVEGVQAAEEKFRTALKETT